MSRKVVAIVGSYRKGGTTDSVVESIMEAAREKGAETNTIYLRERHVEFCNNCRACTQQPGTERGKCIQQDDMESILMEIDSADALVLGSPVNYFNVTAIFRRFMERLLVSNYWPWGARSPVMRSKLIPRKAVLVASTAMPGFMLPLCTGAPKALKITAKSLGAKSIGNLWIGTVAGEPQRMLPHSTRQRARQLGMKLV